MSRRAHCQPDYTRSREAPGGVTGTIAWPEFLEAHARGRFRNSADHIQARGGLGYAEIASLLGREPATWRSW